VLPIARQASRSGQSTPEAYPIRVVCAGSWTGAVPSVAQRRLLPTVGNSVPDAFSKAGVIHRTRREIGKGARREIGRKMGL